MQNHEKIGQQSKFHEFKKKHDFSKHVVSHVILNNYTYFRLDPSICNMKRRERFNLNDEYYSLSLSMFPSIRDNPRLFNRKRDFHGMLFRFYTLYDNYHPI